MCLHSIWPSLGKRNFDSAGNLGEGAILVTFPGSGGPAEQQQQKWWQ